MKQESLLFSILFVFILSLASCDEPISKDDAKRQLDTYFTDHSPTFTFYIPIKDNFLWKNDLSNNGDSNYIKNSQNINIKYCMHLMNNLQIFGAVNYHFVKEPEGCRIITEFTDKFKSIIKERSHWDNDSNGEHITIISGQLKTEILSTETGRYNDGRAASMVNFKTEFTPNDIRNIFSSGKDEGMDFKKANFYKTQGGWQLDANN